MQVYEAPLRDMRFVLDELWIDDGFGDLPALADFDSDLTNAILEEAARFSREVLLPLNLSGDEEGCHLENGVVRTPTGFKDAYKQFTDSGWAALAADPEWGGQGLPERVNKLVEEMTCSTNLSFGLYPGLTHGGSLALEAHGSDELKRAYLPKMTSGQWSGTMCLTESHCGTDLGMLRTKAMPQGDGSYKVSGAKIFISAGDHDLTENVIHLVLARTPDAPAGVKGISMFLVPKYLPKEDGTPGPSNGVLCTALEHKMGLKASATCHGRDVHDDECRTAFGRHSGAGDWRGRLSIGGMVRQGPVAGPCALGREVSRKSRRSDHRPPRCAADADDDAR